MVAIKYCGTFQDATGYGSANRAFATALHIAGVDVTTDLLVQTLDRTLFGWEGELCHQLKDRDIPYKVKIIHLTPDLYEKHTEKGIYHIGHLFWETDRLPKEWIEASKNVQEIWTSSENMAAVFKANGIKVPIKWFPQPIDISIAHKDYGRFAVPNTNGFLFYSIFQWIERKNPRALLTAFWEAFRGRDDVALLLKTFRLSYDEPEFEKIRDDIRDWKKTVNGPHPTIIMANYIFTQEQIMKLHQTGDCYVQTDRGEGWSRTVQEALAMAKPVIATARGGIHEYLNKDLYFGIPSTYIPVTEIPWVKFYYGDQQWAEIDHEKLKQAMLYVFANYKVAQAKGVMAREHIKNNFSYQKVGNMMKDRLEEIYKGL